MTSVNLKSIESFSSEDPNHPAANLLKPGNKKWKCAAAGEKNAFVVIRLEEPVQLGGVDIGNEHSAFVEVLVARSGSSNPKFTELLLSTKFMNPVESRNSTSPNRVQFFNKSALVPSAIEEKWDLVKFICTQPFNSRVKYGLTFVALHGIGTEKKEKCLVPASFQKQIKEAAEKGNVSNVPTITFGRFKLREDSPDSDGADGPDGSSKVFARWKAKQKPDSLRVATSVSALMRDSVTPEAMQKNIPLPGSVRNVVLSRPKAQKYDSSDDDPIPPKANDKPIQNRNSVALLYDEEDEKPEDKKLNESISRYGVVERKKDAPKPGDTAAKESSTKQHNVSSSKFKEFLDITGQTIVDRTSKSTKEEKSGPRMKASDPKPSTSHVSPSHDSNNKSTSELPKPVRSPLPIEKQPVAKKRLSSPTAANSSEEHFTKKVKTSASVAESDEEVEKKVQYKPFRSLLDNVVLVISGIQNPERGEIRSKALAMGAKYKPDWDASCTHLICAYKNTPKYNQVRGKGKIIKKDWIVACYNHRKRFSWRKFAMDTDETNVSDSEEEIVDIANKPPDTVAAKPAKKTGKPVILYEFSDSDTEAASGANRVYDLSTEEEGNPNEETSAGNDDFFKGKSFYLDSEVGAIDIIKLEKFIQTYKGTLRKGLHDVDYIITRNHKHVVPPDSRAKLIKPLWIYECVDMECLIPVQRYILQEV